MTDLHCHIFPGIDDGPDALEGSIGLERGDLGARTKDAGDPIRQDEPAG